MKITTEEGLRRLAANPQVAAEFDRCAPGLSRREHVQKTIAAIDAAIAENTALKVKMAATKAKAAALEAASKSQPASFMKTTPTKAPTAIAPAAKLTTAAEFQAANKPPTMKRSEFNNLTNSERNQWIREGGKLV